MTHPLLPPFGDYIVFADESGTPYLTTVDPTYPIFVLVFCVIHKAIYTEKIQPAIKKLKFEFFGHDMGILHANAIRKPSGDFSFLLHTERRELFFNRLNNILASADFQLITHVIDKQKLKEKYLKPFDPYHIALRMCVEQLNHFLTEHHQTGKITHIIAESRGEREDRDLELEFRRILDPAHNWGMANLFKVTDTPLELKFVEKKINSTGLQFADLVSQPIGRHLLSPIQNSRAFDIIQPKIWRQIWRFP